MANQATEVPEDVGKMLTLTHNYAKHMIVPGEAAVVHRHVVVSGKTSLNKTDLLILSVADAARVMAEDTKKMTIVEIGTEFARIKLDGLSNGDLGKILGAGKWKDLFDARAARIDHSISKPADASLVALLGKRLEGEGHVHEDDAMQIVDAEWVVKNLTDDGTKLILETVAEPKRVTMGMPPVWVKAKIAAFESKKQVSNVTNAEIDLADYGAGGTMLLKVHGSQGSTVLDARVILRVHMQAGARRIVPVQPDDAAPDALRLDARAAMADLDQRLATIGWNKINAKEVTSEVLLKQICKTLYTGDCVLPGDRKTAPIDALASKTGSTVHTVSKTPRYDAVRKIASSNEEFDTFTKQAAAWFVADKEQREIILSHEVTRAGQFESWLKRMGPQADPALISGMGGSTGLDAGELLQIFIEMAGATGGPKGFDLPSASNAFDGRVRFTVRTDHGGDTISDLEKRERSAIQADFQTIEGSSDQLALLRKWSDWSMSNDDQRRADVSAAVKELPDGALKRLMRVIDPHAATVEADPSTVQAVSTVRGVLESALSVAVYGKSSTTQPERCNRALKCVRSGQIGKTKLLHLIDQDDSASVEDPLKGFAKLQSNVAAVELSRAFTRLQAAWIFSYAPHAAAIVQFMMALSEKIFQAHAAGVSWADLSTYYYKVMRRASQVATGVNGSPGSSPEAPNPLWAKDPTFEWVVELDRASTIALASSAASVASAAAIAAISPSQNSKRAGDNAAQSSGAATPQMKKSKKGAKPTPSVKPAHQASKGPAVKSEPAAKSEPAVKKEPFADMRKRVEAELLQTLGEKDNKPPCFFYHHLQKCRYSADQCTCGYH